MTKAQKKTDANTTDLREQADAAVAAWRDAEAKASAAATAFVACKSPDSLEGIITEATRFETKDAAALARQAASVALAAVEVAEGDELATRCSPARLRGELGGLVAEEKRLHAEWLEAGRRRTSFAHGVQASLKALQERRAAAQLPPPVHFPSLGGHVDALLAELDRAAVDGFAAAPSLNEGRIKSLRSKEVRIRAELERAAREREEEAAAATREAKRREKARAEQAAAEAAENEAHLKRQAAVEAETRALADAHRARTTHAAE